MDQSTLGSIRGRFPAVVPFSYFRDRYALLLLAHAARAGVKKSVLAKTVFGRLLTKPIVKEALARAGDGIVDASIADLWPARPLAFRRTLGVWGESGTGFRPHHHQMSRPGGNLVVQLNFSCDHERHYRALLRPVGDSQPFNYDRHPISKTLATLSWARVDLDFETGEALVEEVQSDWVRVVERCRGRLSPRPGRHVRGLGFGTVDASVTRARLDRYVDRHLWPLARVWEEATLAATIELLHVELGVSRIFFHTNDGGRAIKELPRAACPPERIYRALPERFCFVETSEAPRFLLERSGPSVRDRMRQLRPRFYRLELPPTVPIARRGRGG
jgi:hypothetical protein